MVALRKESVDRNLDHGIALVPHQVALRKESVDRNRSWTGTGQFLLLSLSARRAWIEILVFNFGRLHYNVALRKESVDRNPGRQQAFNSVNASLSARRAWIEILVGRAESGWLPRRSPQGERG